MSSDINTSSEDELLASSQETIANKDSVASTSHSTPAQSKQPSTSKTAAKDTRHSDQKPPKKRKSSGALLRNQYQKALFILSKIAKNEAAGTVHERDQVDKRKYQKIVEEYNNRLAAKERQPEQMATKRNRSQDGIDSSAKRSKVARTVAKTAATNKPSAPPADSSRPRRPLSEVVRDHLKVALVDECATGGRLKMEAWGAIEARLSEMVMDHILTSQGGPLPCFDSSEVIRGCRVIKCEDQFSRDFLGSCVAKVSDAWEGMKLKLIPTEEIPRRPRARIWLPKMKLDSGKLLQCLRLHNPAVPMDDWAVIKAEQPQTSSMSFLLLINNECLETLEKADYRLRFGIRHAKLKIFRTSNPDDELDPVDGANELLDDMRIEETAPKKTDAESRAD